MRTEENKMMKVDEFVDYMVRLTNSSLTSLAALIGVSRQTLNNWRKGYVDKLDYITINKLDKAAMENKWGFRLGKIEGSNIEIIFNEPVLSELEDSPTTKLSELQELVNKLVKENFTLKEKLQKYESQ